MSPTQTRFTPFRAVLALVVVAAAITFWTYPSSSPPVVGANSPRVKSQEVMAANNDVLSHIAVKVRQTSSSPATVAVDVTNNNKDVPLAILNWESPLDPSALALGLFYLTPEGASAPLEYPTIAFRRMMPPPPESFVTIRPGETKTQEHVIQPDLLKPEDLGPKPTLIIKGQWTGIWTVPADELPPERLNDLYSDPERLSGSVETEPLQLTLG